MRSRPRAVALSISLVIAASAGGTASAATQPSSAGNDAAPALLQDVGPALGDDDGSLDDDPGADHNASSLG